MTDVSFPVSLAQRRLWFASQLDPGSCEYTLGRVFRLLGRLSTPALGAALSGIVQRHPSLRTRFTDQDSALRQVIDAAWDGGLNVHDACANPDVDGEDTDGEEAARRLLSDVFTCPFDLKAGPLFRADLFVLGTDDYVLALTMHHIVSDGWSLNIMLRDLELLYTAALGDSPPGLPAPTVSYQELVAEELQELSGPVLERQLDYWREHVAGVPDLLPLPTKQDKPVRPSARGRFVDFELPAGLAGRLSSLATANGATFYMVALAAYQVLLSRLCDMRELLVGMPVSVRPLPVADDVVGFFINTLPVRADLRDDPTFTQLLTRARDSVLMAYLHRSVPFDSIVEAVNPQRRIGSSPLIQATLQVFDDAVGTELRLPGLSVSHYALPERSVPFELSFDLYNTDGELSGQAYYREDVFEAATIEWCIAAFRNLLVSVAADPDRPVCALPLLDPARRTAVAALGAGEPSTVRTVPMPERLAEQIAAEPDAILVVENDRPVSAATFGGDVTAIAAALAARGIGVGGLVGITGSLSYPALTAVFAAWRAGAAVILALDGFPADEAAAPDIVLAAGHTTHAGQFAIADLMAASSPPELPAAISRTDEHAPALLLPVDELAGPCVALVDHAALAALLSAHRTQATARRTAITSETWRAAPWQALLWLLSDAEVHLLGQTNQAGKATAPGLIRYLAEHDIQLVETTADEIAALLSAPDRAMPGLAGRTIVASTQTTSPATRQACDVAGATVIYRYGQPECLGHTLLWHGEDQSACLPAGGVQVRVLDPAGQPVPPGVAGEVCVGAAHLALGYPGRNVETALRLRPDPLLDEPQPLLFHTGERGRLTPDGHVQLLGVRQLDEPQAPAGDFVAPRGGVESVVAGVFEEVLGVRAGRHDDFFALGGHSLSAVRLASRLRAVLGADVSVQLVFECRTVSRLAAAAGEAAHRPATPLTARQRPDEPAPASFAQQRLWFIQQLDPGGCSYNMNEVFRVRGDLDLAALAAAAAALADRHESLRTRFAETSGGVVQVVDPRWQGRLEVTDLAGHGDPGAAAGHLARILSRPFDLAAGPLFRADVLRLGPADHVLALTMHHIISDGWSMKILLEDLSALYSGDPARPVPALRYGDFAAWQRDTLQGEALDVHLDYWLEQLGDAPQFLDLHPDFRPTDAVGGDGGVVRFDIPAGLAGRLRDLARSSGATLFMVTLAVFQVLMSRLSGEPDLLVGIPVAGRTQPETEDLIGFFVNTLPLRADLRENPTGTELLAATRDRVLSAFAHQDLPFDRIVEAANPDRVLGVNPLVQVTFQLFEQEPAGFPLPGIEVSHHERPVTLPLDVALALDLFTANDAVNGLLYFRRDLFRQDTAERITGCYQALLAALTANPDRQVSSLPLLPPGAPAAIATGPHAPVPAGLTILDLLDQQLTAQPDATAITTSAARWTYRQLDTAATAVTAALTSRNVQPGSRVALLADRTPHLIAAIIGTLRAGAAVIPLDPAQPPERLRAILTDAAPDLILTDPTTTPHATGLGPPLADITESPAGAPAPIARSVVSPGDPAVILYTSGSTGRPKGVLLEHRGFVNLLVSHRASVIPCAQRTAGRARLRVAVTSSIAFDASWDELLWMIDGHELYLVDEHTRRNSEALLDEVRRQRLDVLDSPQSQVLHLIDLGLLDAAEHRPSVLLLGGEAIQPSLWERLRAEPGIEAFNFYGPTECTIDALTARVADHDRPLIGRPIANTCVRILDSDQQPVPPGIVGEIYLGGPHLARGYLNQPAQTADRFLPDPWASQPGQRLYRTGDLGRLTPSGHVEFLGRVDRQLKIRGYRIEPAEIESTLLRLPHIRDAAVTTRTDLDQPRLIAYLVPTDDQRLDPALLRSHVASHLPDYLVPSAFVTMAELPRTIAGKLDDDRLPEPDATAFAGDFVAPRGGVESVVAGVFEEVLGVRAGRHDDFFALGGHSLSAVRLASRLRAVLGADVSVQLVFECRTVSRLAAAAGEAAHRPATPLTARQRPDEPAPASFAQQRLWFIQQLDPGGCSYNMNEVFRVRGDLDLAALAAAAAALADRHESLRTRFAETSGGVVQVVDPRWQGRLEVTDLAGHGDPGAAAGHLARILSRPFDLAAGPLFRADVLRLGPADHVLALTMHHIISDGWSMKILLEDLSALYSGDPARPVPALRYGDFAAWQRDTLQGEALDVHLDYWLEQLGDAPQFLDLHPDFRPTDAVGGDGGVVRFDIPAGLAGRLRDLARSSGATLFMVTLAVFQVLMSRLSGEPDLLVGIPVAGRTQPETEDLIGFFVNTLPLRADLRENPTGTELLAATRDRVLSAFAHQDLPFDRIVEAANPDRVLGVNPLVQVTFQLFEQEPANDLELVGTTSSVHDTFNGTARFDLSVDLYRTGDALAGSLYFRRDLFRQDTAERITGCYQALLAALTANPDRQVSSLPLLPPGAPAAIATGPHAPVPAGLTILDLLDQQLTAQPDATAITTSAARWTYRQLDTAATAVTAALTSRNVQPGSRVALLADRTPHLIAAIIGTLRAGAAVIPLDPAQPPERLRAILTDAAPDLILTDPTTTPHATGLGPPTHDMTSIACAEAVLHDGQDGPTRRPRPEDVAYVIFTSGSTGQPKGVVVEHRGLINLIMGHRESHYRSAVRAAGHDRLRVAHVSAFTFDASWDQLLWMIDGHELYLADEDTRHDSEAMVAFLDEHRIDVLNTTPSYVEQLVADGMLDQGRRHPAFFVLGGEGVRPSLWERLRAEPGIEAFNFYGPTECTIVSLTARVADHDRPLIGRPIANTCVRILDSDQQPVPPGIVGEIYLGGPHLARGYLNQPAQTADRFLPDPWASQPGQRLYRTGDLGRLTPSGHVEFLGRVDRQLKIRGYRIEPAEIESTLLRLPHIRDAAVTTRTDLDQPRLIAYLVPTDEGGSAASLVASWQSVFEDTHQSVSRAEHTDAAIIGWNDSFSGQAIPAAQMREWVDATVTRILELAPRKVLEIGAGTGLMVRPLLEQAPVSHYAATDFSALTVQMIDKITAAAHPLHLNARIEAAQAEAVDAVAALPGEYDTVVINSVAQYFPSLRYLERTLERALTAVTSGGHIFLGDLRNAALLDAFAALKHHMLRADGETDDNVIARAVRELRTDGELSIHPGYLATLLDRFTAITAVEVAPRRGESFNEMTLFRYDVILHVGCPAEPEAVSWASGADLTIREIERRLSLGGGAFGYRDLPNGRLDEALRLRDQFGLTPTGTPRRGNAPGLDLEAAYRAGARYGWLTRVGWASSGATGTVDLAFHPADSATDTHFRSAPGLIRTRSRPVRGPVRADPMFAPRMAGLLTDLVRAELANVLPDYLIPAEFVFLADLPRLPSGKIDLGALPQVSGTSTTGSRQATGRPVQTAAETVTEIFSRVLKTHVMPEDDFFAIGGDSLAASLCIRELRNHQLPVSIRDLFLHRTPVALAAVVREGAPSESSEHNS